MRKLNLQNIIWKEGKYYIGQCLNIDVSSFGKTKTEAIKNLKEAIELYFEDIKTPQIRKIEQPIVVGQSFCHA